MEFVFPCQSGGFKAFRNESDESARRLTSRGPDGGGDGGRAHGRHTLVILRVAGLDGTQVAVAACAEAAGQIQRLHGLRFHLAEHRLAHRLELAVHLSLAHLKRPECRFFFFLQVIQLLSKPFPRLSPSLFQKARVYHLPSLHTFSLFSTVFN